MLQGPTVTLVHDGTALEKRRRVKWSGTALSYCSATEDHIGHTVDPVLTGDTRVTVELAGSGKKRMTAAGAFAVGAKVYGAANGKVDDAVTTKLVGQALEAATADGEQVEVIELAETGIPS